MSRYKTEKKSKIPEFVWTMQSIRNLGILLSVSNNCKFSKWRQDLAQIGQDGINLETPDQCYLSRFGQRGALIPGTALYTNLGCRRSFGEYIQC